MYILPINDMSFKAVSIEKKLLEKTAKQTILKECEDRLKNLTTKDNGAVLERLREQIENIKVQISLERSAALSKIEQGFWETNEHFRKRESKIYESYAEEEKHQIKEAEASAISEMKENNLYNEQVKTQGEQINTQINTAIAQNDQTDLNKRLREADTYQTARTASMKGKGFDKIAGYEEEKEILYKYFIKEIKKERNGEEANIPGSVLFFGPRGMGKSTFYKAFAEEAECDSSDCSLRLPTVAKSTDMKEGMHIVFSRLIKKAIEANELFQTTGKRTILFIDELTRLVSKSSPVLEDVSNFLSTCSEKYHCTVFAATNYPEQIGLNLEGNKSIFPIRVALEPPSLDDKAKILKFYLNKRVPTETDYKALAKQIEEKEKAEGKMYSINRIIGICEKLKVNDNIQQNFSSAIEKINPVITKEQLEQYSDNYNSLIENLVLGDK